MSPLSMPTEELLALYAAFVNEWIPQKRAELQAQKSRLAAASKKTQPMETTSVRPMETTSVRPMKTTSVQPGEEKTSQAPAWLFGTGNPQERETEELIASAPTTIPVVEQPVQPMMTIPVEPDETADALPVEDLASDSIGDELAAVEPEASPAAKSEDGWL